MRGEKTDAKIYLKEALELLDKLNLRAKAADILEEFGYLAHSLQQSKRAIKLWASAFKLRSDIGQPLPICDQVRYEEHLLSTKETLGEEAFQVAWTAGEAMTLEEAVTYALEPTPPDTL